MSGDEQPPAPRPPVPWSEVALAWFDEAAELLARGQHALDSEVATADVAGDLSWVPERLDRLRGARAATEYAAKLTWCARREILATLRAESGVRP